MIPANKIVSVNPSVLSAGGVAVALNGLILSAATAIPLGTVQNFSTAKAVSDVFGASSTEAGLAAVYFAGYDGSTQKPGNLLIAQYPTAAVAAYLRSGSMSQLTLAQIQAIAPGTLSITVNGVVKTTTSVDLSTSTSYSDAASKISAGFTSGPVVSFSSQRNAFEFTSSTTGAASTIGFGSGALAAPLLLTQATGATTSQGAIAATPAAFMTALTASALNWATFMTAFEPLLADKTAFATWNAQQNYRFAYVCWDTDANAIVPGNTTSIGALGLAGTIPVYTSPLHAAFIMGIAASSDFARRNGRSTAAFKSQLGLVASVTDATIADTLKANGYNFYGQYATSATVDTFLYPGQVGGAFKYIDSYINQIWLNSALQASMLTLLRNAGSIPYNAQGYTQIEQTLSDPVAAALNYGAIRPGVQLSASQISQVNSSAGLSIDQALSTRGWYLQVLPATPDVRAVRGSPPCTLWYMDGGSIQALNLASIALQ